MSKRSDDDIDSGALDHVHDYFRRFLCEREEDLMRIIIMHVRKSCYCGNEPIEDIAKDIYSDTYTEVMKTAAKFDMSRHPWPWIHRIAVCGVLRHNAYKAKCHKRETSIDLYSDNIDYSQSDHAPQIIEQENMKGVLARLSLGDQEILQLVDYDRLSLQEAATEAGIEYEAAKRRHSRAILRFVNEYKRQCSLGEAKNAQF